MKEASDNVDSNRKRRLPLNILGLRETEFCRTFLGSTITEIELPTNQSAAATWCLRVFFDNEKLIELSAAITSVGGWRETGSLKILVMSSASDQSLEIAGPRFIRRQIDPIEVHSIFKLVYEDPNYLSECGIVFTSEAGKEMTVAAGPAPGSVTFKGHFDKSNYRPEHLERDYSKVNLC